MRPTNHGGRRAQISNGLQKTATDRTFFFSLGANFFLFFSFLYENNITSVGEGKEVLLPPRRHGGGK